MTTSHPPFVVAITADAVRPDGSSVHGDLGLQRLTDAGVEWRVLPTYQDPIPPEHLAGVDAVLSRGTPALAPKPWQPPRG